MKEIQSKGWVKTLLVGRGATSFFHFATTKDIKKSRPTGRALARLLLLLSGICATIAAWALNLNDMLERNNKTKPSGGGQNADEPLASRLWLGLFEHPPGALETRPHNPAIRDF
ncbi:hypothetical protein ASPCAL04561 [Aspergillus calidoustus]|uniref:Uncharacterized protein n=1 Tax=Aspergillus calidoustus TaxID=454130 RepID=A0A0U5FYJ8_ASPCI|nr:hypothetical protein ASPCAL04561 [Aspergillus calidoustus]